MSHLALTHLASKRYRIPVLLLAVTPGVAFAAKLPTELQAIEKKYAQAKTVQAEFSQLNTIASLKQTKKSQGKLAFKTPGMIRWQETQPDQTLLVSDGKTYWHYTPPFDEGERGQVLIRKASQVQSKLANSLLSGSFSGAVSQKAKVVKKSPSLFVLTPGKGTAGTVSKAEIEIDPEKQLIQKVTLYHRGGNRSEVSLSQIELGAELPDSEFKFEIPPNTDKITE